MKVLMQGKKGRVLMEWLKDTLLIILWILESWSPCLVLQIFHNFQKLGVVVKPTEKSRLVLRFIWMEKNIGIALDQMDLAMALFLSTLITFGQGEMLGKSPRSARV